MNKQQLPKLTPSLDEIDKLLPIIPKTINELIYEYVGNPFIITLNFTGNKKPKIIIPLISATNVFYIDWGDNNYVSDQFNNNYHEYAQNGTYVVHIYGDITHISFNGIHELVEISQWGCLRLYSGYMCFKGCYRLTITAYDLPNLKNAKNLSHMFEGCEKFNADLSKWDISNGTNMDCMFRDCHASKSDFGEWVLIILSISYIFFALVILLMSD
jgi:surface protein